MKSHCVDALVPRFSKRADAGNSSSFRELEIDTNAVWNNPVIDFPNEDQHVSLTAPLERVEIQVLQGSVLCCTDDTHQLCTLARGGG